MKDSFVTVGMAFLVILLLAGCAILYERTERTDEITVLRVDTTVSGSGETASGQYLVYAELADGSRETFENEDCLITFKFNSSDVQGELATNIGGRYRIRSYGWRIPFLSSYRTICSLQALE